MVRRRLLLALPFALITRLAAAQAYAPIVTISVTMPDGRTQELTAPESGIATLQLKDGTEYGLPPYDSGQFTVESDRRHDLQNGYHQCTNNSPRGGRTQEGWFRGRVQDESFVQGVRPESVAASDRAGDSIDDWVNA